MPLCNRINTKAIIYKILVYNKKRCSPSFYVIFNHKIWLLKSSRIINAIGSSKKEICQRLLLTGKIDDDQEIDTPIDFKYVMGV